MAIRKRIPEVTETHTRKVLLIQEPIGST